jgi:hypothetical protein
MTKGVDSSLSLRMTKKCSDAVLNRSEGMTPFCHPEAKPKGLLRGFFAVAQNDRIVQNIIFYRQFQDKVRLKII